MVARKSSGLQKKVITFLAVTSNVTRGQYEWILVADVPRNLFSYLTAPTDKKVVEKLD